MAQTKQPVYTNLARKATRNKSVMEVMLTIGLKSTKVFTVQIYILCIIWLSHDLRLKVAFMLLFLKKEHLSMLLARNYEAIEDC